MASVFNLAASVTKTSWIRQATALAYIRTVNNQLKLFYNLHLHGADEATSCVSDSALPPPPTKFKKKVVVRAGVELLRRLGT